MIKVTCAIIRNEDNQVLVVQRGEKSDHPFKWEFPGGKINEGESEEECILREIKEELSMDIVICGRLAEKEHDYGHKHILLIPFICDTLDELPLLTEHIDFRWVGAEDLPGIDFSEADITVAENYLSDYKTPGVNQETDEDIDLPVSLDEDLRSMINGIMSTKEVEWVAGSAIENPAIFRKLLDYSFSEDPRLAFRSSWTLTKVCDRYQDLIYPHLERMVEGLRKVENESTQRSFLKMISLSDMNRLTVKQHGMLADYCFNALRSGFSAIAVRAYSMEILYNLAVIYPELVNEISTTINLLQEEGSAGIVAKGRMVIKRLAEIPPVKKDIKE